MLNITANDIMSEHVVVIYDDMLIRQFAHLMLRDRVSGFPVVNAKVGLVGIITMSDLFFIIDRASGDCESLDDFDDKIAAFKDKAVAEFMSKEVSTITPQTTLKEILDMLVHKKIHVFPVMEDGKIVGIVSRHDILNAIYSFD